MTTQPPEHELAVAAPIPVSGEIEIRAIHGAAVVHDEAADFGACFTVPLAGTENPAQLLPYDVNRARAYISCVHAGPASVAIPDPALGASLVYTLPAAAQVLAFTATYTAGAATGNRFPTLNILDAAGNTVANMGWTSSGIAPSTFDTVWAALNAQFAVNDQFNSFIVIPNLGVLPAGFRVQLPIQNGGDQISGARILMSGSVWIGTAAQCAQVKNGNTAGGGFQLRTGQTLPVSSKQPVYLVPDGRSAAIVSVSAERWES